MTVAMAFLLTPQQVLTLISDTLGHLRLFPSQCCTQISFRALTREQA